MIFNNPLSQEKADRIIHLFELPTSAMVLDAGCGTGEFLTRTVNRYKCSGVGIDINSESISAAKTAATDRNLDHRIEFRTGDLRTLTMPENQFDLVICLGSSHAFGDGESAYRAAIHKLSFWVIPGGLIFFGEGYWKRPPAQPYLELIGEPVGIYRGHSENITFAEELGLTPLYAAVSNDDEWDHFEWSHRMKIERAARQSPEDRESQDELAISRRWRDGYLRWGRSTMGFGFYLFLNNHF